MPGKTRRRTRSGSLGSLKAALWAVIAYNLDVVEDEGGDHELRQRASHALVQAALAYGKVLEFYDLDARMKTLEQLATGNGHRP